ncbi:MAG TPA: dTDP-4-dehydrorhamnose 3,5-epimerase [Burkholderiaceae bacterium]|nr:dTDP-4-dehydrorhamnose 3,5-epimerase [Burkholderiaceae bacterium]
MKIVDTRLPGLVELEPRVFSDARGCFYESYNARTFAALLPGSPDFVQDNHACSEGAVLRGLHYQVQQPQGKLMRVVRGAVFDVAVDLRKSSPTYGRWYGCELSEENRKMLYVPPGFAHGYLVTRGPADFLYKTTDYWAPQHERCIRWDDPELAIDWPLAGRKPILSDKDLAGLSWQQADKFE